MSGRGSGKPGCGHMHYRLFEKLSCKGNRNWLEGKVGGKVEGKQEG